MRLFRLIMTINYVHLFSLTQPETWECLIARTAGIPGGKQAEIPLKTQSLRNGME